MEVRAYRNEDLALMPPRACEVRTAELETQLAWIGQLRIQNPAFTLWDGDKPVGSAGLIIFQTGVAEAWLRGSVRMQDHPIACALEVRRRFAKLAREHRLRRVQAIVRTDNQLAVWFARWLGFSVEGTMRRLGPEGEDLYMMAWLSDMEVR